MQPSLNSAKIEDFVERLCLDGCQAVRSYITQLEQTETQSLFEGLNEEEKQQVLDELKAIMSVYDRCSVIDTAANPPTYPQTQRSVG